MAQVADDEYEYLDDEDEYEYLPPKKKSIPELYKTGTLKEQLLETAPAKVVRSAARGVTDLAKLAALAYLPGEKLGQAAFGTEGPSKLQTISEAEEEYLRPEEAEEDFLLQIPQRAVRSGPFGALGLIGEATGLAAQQAVKATGGDETAQIVADIVGALGGTFGAVQAGERTALRVAQSATAAEQALTKPSAATTPYRTRLGRDILETAANTPVPKPIQLPGSKAPDKLTKLAGTKFNVGAQQTERAIGERAVNDLAKPQISEFGELASQMGQPSLGEASDFSARQVASQISDTNKKPWLDALSPVEDELTAWQYVQKHVRDNFEKARKTYTGLYEAVRRQVGNFAFTPKNSRRELDVIQKRLGSLKTMPPGYGALNASIKQIEHDLGIVTAHLDDFAMKIDEAKTIGEIQDLAIRVGDLINWEGIDKTVKQWLKPLQKALKQDVREGMRQSGNKLAVPAFNKAEKAYADTARTFGTDAVIKLRTTKNPETMTQLFSAPSNLSNLRQVTTASQLAPGERHIIESISRGSTEPALRDLKQIGRHLTENGRQVADEIIRLGDKLTSSGSKLATQNGVLQDVQQAVTQGLRPDYTMKVMQTPQGYDIVKQTLGSSEAGRKIFSSIERIAVDDFFQSIIKETGSIDFGKLKGFLENPDFRKVFEKIAGREGVEFLTSLDSKAAKMGSNLERLELMSQSHIAKGKGKGKETLSKAAQRAQQPSKTKRLGAEISQREKVPTKRGEYLLEKLRPSEAPKAPKEPKEVSFKRRIYDYFPFQTKAMFAVLGMPWIGKSAVVALGALELGRAFYKLIKNPKVRQGINRLASSKGFTRPVASSALRLINEGMEGEEF